MADFANVEDVIATWLNGQTGVRVVSETPNPLPTQLIELVRIGGTDVDAGIDVATIDVTTWSATDDPSADRDAAAALGETVRTAIREHLVGQRLTGFVVSRTQTLSAPAWRPYDDLTCRRFGALYQLILHRQ